MDNFEFVNNHAIMQWPLIARQIGAYLQQNLSFIWQQRLHPAGMPYVLMTAAGTIFFALIQSSLAFWFGWLAVITFWLFREPKRQVPNIPAVLVSPVDGEIVHISRRPSPQDISMDYHCIEIYTRLFQPHTLRSPVSGTVVHFIYQNGEWFKEWQQADEAAEQVAPEHGLVILQQNNQNIIMEHEGGIIPSRLDFDIKEHDMLLQGQRYGASHFGGLMRLYIPLSFTLSVYESQNVQGGETILALQPAAI